MAIPSPGDHANLHHDFEDFFERSLNGYVIVSAEKKILRANAKLAEWIGCQPADLTGIPFQQLFSIGGRIYFETHLGPLLTMQGFFDEVALQLKTASGEKLDVLCNAFNRRKDDGTLLFTRVSFYKASDRRKYEQNLQTAKSDAETSLQTEIAHSHLREQFIAVLGHDLRNPLGSVTAGASLLLAADIDDAHKNIARIISRSAQRMNALISDVMDFARSWLGAGLALNISVSDTVPILNQVCAELRFIWPARSIEFNSGASAEIACDAFRIGQLASNLLANALTHGSPDTPVVLSTRIESGLFILEVVNNGKVIPASVIATIFEPFTRENTNASQQGLGLGLFIAFQVAKAHKGALSVSSTEKNTTFIFRMPVSQV